MNTKRMWSLCCSLLLWVLFAGAQDGSLDPSFNGALTSVYGTGLGPDNFVRAIVVQPDGKIVIGGGFFTYNGSLTGRVTRLNADGSIDNTFNPGGNISQTNPNVICMATAIVRQPDGKLIVSGSFTHFNGVARAGIVRINTDGSLDASFDPGTGASGINALGLQADGKIIAAGSFTTFNGQTANRIVRLNTDGSIDGTFNSGTGLDGAVSRVLLQPDGKILIGGGFAAYNGVLRLRVARINTDGTLDTGFAGGNAQTSGVNAIALQPDGKVLIGGNFTNYQNVNYNRIIRVNTNGVVDATFNPGAGANGQVNTISIQSNGKIIIAGNFTRFDGNTVSRFARLQADGAYDPGFSVGSTFAASQVLTTVLQPDDKVLAGGVFQDANQYDITYMTRMQPDGAIDPAWNRQVGPLFSLNKILVQPDQKVLIGGNFPQYNGTAAHYLARLNSDGTLDATFNTTIGADNGVTDIALQPDGKVIIAGDFLTYAGVSSPYIARLNTDGSRDASFITGTGFDGTVYGVRLQTNGKILAFGSFSLYNGTPCPGLVRLNSDGSIDGTFSVGTGCDNYISDLVIQADGKIIIGGGFTLYDGAPASRIVRLQTNGAIDPSYQAGTAFDSDVSKFLLQPNGKLLVFGDFANYQGLPAAKMARLNTDGTRDATFTSALPVSTFSSLTAVALQPDGRIIIGGGILDVPNGTTPGIARLLADGSLDNGFNPGSGINSDGLYSLALQNDGKILAAGEFFSYNDQITVRIARINAKSLTTTDVSPANYCVGTATPVTVSYQAAGSFDPANVFTAELSDASGSFAAPVVIGSVASSVSGTINATIPANTPVGTGYRVRVVASNPAYTGSDNQVDLAVNPLPSASITAFTNISCYQGNNGSLTVTATGGTPGYSYQWTPSGGTAATASGLTAGAYSVLVTDSKGCTASAGKTLTEPATAVSGTAMVTPNTCYGNSAGAIAITPAGGVPGYTYQWADGPTTQNRSGLPAGSYSVTITDANGCTFVLSNISVGQPAQITMNAVSSQELCNGGTTTALTFSGAGLTAQYAWTNNNPGVGLAASGNGNIASFTAVNGGTSAQTAVITVTPSVSGCPGAAVQFSIKVNATPAASLNYSGSPYCRSGASALPTLSGTSGGTYSYVNGANTASGLAAFSSVTGSFDPAGSTPGTYTVTYTVAAAGGCGSFTTNTQVTVLDYSTWTGAVNRDWNNAANWCGIIPTSTTDVFLPPVANQPIIYPGNTGSVRRLTVQAGALFTVQGTLQLYGDLTNQGGTLEMSQGILGLEGSTAQQVPAFVVGQLRVNGSGGFTLAGTSAVTGALQFGTNGGKVVLGNFDLSVGSITGGGPDAFVVTNGSGALVRKALSGAQLMPVGVSDQSYTPLMITTSEGLDWSVRVQPGFSGYPAINQAVALQRIWHITPSQTPTTQNTDVNFYYPDALWTTPSMVTVYRFNANGTGWNYGWGDANSITAFNLQAPLENGLRVVRLYGQRAFSPFAIAGATTPLPVTLLRFEGRKLERGNLLEWQTTSEANNRGFVVERSADGRRFADIGWVASRALGGMSQSVLGYRFTDSSISSGRQYYRLRQTDLDGRVHFSAIVVLSRDGSGMQLSCYPNPSAGKVQLQVQDMPAGNYQVAVTDLNGRTLSRTMRRSEGGSAVWSLDLSGCASGTYLVILTDDSGQVAGRAKIVKQ